MAAVAPRRLRADAARNRQALIDAAHRLFVRRGLTVTLDDIAAEAGVNVATAYRHFGNKQELASAFLQQVIEDAEQICERAATAADPWQGIVTFFTDTFDLMMANRGLHDLFTPGLADASLRELDERVEPLVHRLLARAQKSGDLRTDLQPGDIGVIFQMLATLDEIPTPDPEMLGKRYLAFVLDGLRPSATILPGTAPSKDEIRVATVKSATKGGSARR
jgi:AcrR family transcriptional regulator